MSEEAFYINDGMTDEQIEAAAQRLVLADREAYKASVVPISRSKRWRKKRPATCERCGVPCEGFPASRKGSFVCPSCGVIVRVVRNRLLHGFTIPDLKLLTAVHLLAEGVGLRSTHRLLGLGKQSIQKIHETVGLMCRDFLESIIKNVPASAVEVDEMWTYVFKKQHTKRDLEKKNHRVGSAWIYVGLDRHSKMILAYHVGRRTTDDACQFMRKLRAATVGHMTVYTDGFQPYPTAVYSAFLYENKLDALPDFLEHPAVVVRNNGSTGLLHGTDETNYERACTNQIERFNGTFRNGLKRLARRTYAFSKSWVALENTVAIFLAYYNFCKPHKALSGLTPAMAAGLTETRWNIRDLIVEIQKFRDERYQKQRTEQRDVTEVIAGVAG